MKRLSVALILCVLSVLPAGAQIHGGTISGTVTDQQGGVLPGVAVTAQGVDATREFTTDAIGQFRFLSVAPGPYKLSVSLPGFTTVALDVIAAVGRTAD